MRVLAMTGTEIKQFKMDKEERKKKHQEKGNDRKEV